MPVEKQDSISKNEPLSSFSASTFPATFSWPSGLNLSGNENKLIYIYGIYTRQGNLSNYKRTKYPSMLQFFIFKI